MKTRQPTTAPGALDLTEQAVHLLRGKGVTALADYYIGTLPFNLGLLFFWSDMSRNADAGWYCAPAAGGLALLFIWMKVWQVRFCRRLWSVLNDAPAESRSWRRNWATAARQALMQATGLVLLPIAAIIMLPMAWVYAFYQNLSALESPESADLMGLYRNAVRQAALWPGQNHLLLLILSVFALFVAANVAVGMMMAPYLVKWLLGVETAFTISGLHAMTNTTFLAIVCVLSYLCVDPIIKAVYTLRCFYGLSQRTGDDLRAALKPFVKAGLAMLLIVGLVHATNVIPLARGASDSGSQEDGQGNAAYSDRLDESITRVLQERRFAWRLPRDETPPSPAEEQGWLARSLKWMGLKIEAAFSMIGRWLDALAEWLQKSMGLEKMKVDTGGDLRWITRLVFIAVGFVLVGLLLWSIRRWLLERKSAKGDKPSSLREPAIDIDDETVTADDLPRDQWIVMARDLMAKKEYRHAMRAFYLSILSQLGENGRLAIARYKSNRDYQRELDRRVHAEPELCEAFSHCMAAFESAWYGMYPVAEPQLTQFIAEQERIASLVQRTA